MLGWVISLLVLTIMAGILGFTSLAAAMAGGAKVAFSIFIGLFLLTLILYLTRRR